MMASVLKMFLHDGSVELTAMPELLADCREEIVRLFAENRRLDALLNTPELHDFSKAVILEAAHQRERWKDGHDEMKSPSDWLWLIAYLTTKATQAERYGDPDKYLHHIITCAAACSNWHASVSTRKVPGS